MGGCHLTGSSVVQSKIQSKFEIFRKDEVCKIKLGSDNISHNKLRFYSQLNSCFAREPYIDKVTNRNQRAWLSRLRTSSHNLGIERGRYSNVPLADRVCVYCVAGQEQQLHGVAGQQHGDTAVERELDCEVHFLARCPKFKLKRACFVKRLECFIPSISKMTEIDFVKTILCPVKPQIAKLVDKFIGLMFKARDEINSGTVSTEYPTWDPNLANPFKVYDVENDDETHHLDDEEATTNSSEGEYEFIDE